MSKKLLLADDSITIQKVIGITFANEDYELVVVDNGIAALEMARKINPDMILADVFMPGKNGYELCSAVKKDPTLAAIPLLLLTGTFEPFDENKARTAGADSWIAKPFESQALIDRVEELLSRAPLAPPAPAVQPTPVPSPVPPAAAGAAPPAAAAPVVADDLWGEEPLSAAVQETPAPMADAWQTTATDDDLWGGIAMDEPAAQPAVAAAAADPFAMPADDDWGDLINETPPVRLPEAAPVVQGTVAYVQPAAVAAVQAPAAATSWDNFDDEILSLDEGDIIEAEDLEDVGFDAPEMAAEPEMFDPFAEEDAAPATDAGWGAASPVAPAPAWNDMAVPAAAGADAWELTDDDEPAQRPLRGAGSAAMAPAPLPIDVAPAIPAAAAVAADPWRIEAAPVEPVAATAPAAPMVPPQVPPAPVSAAAIENQVAALSEAEITRIVEKITGAIIERLAPAVLEKIVWEVVPDLAEAMIRDEIRTIKESVK